jgi:hypothetical protein
VRSKRTVIGIPLHVLITQGNGNRRRHFVNRT